MQSIRFIQWWYKAIPDDTFQGRQLSAHRRERGMHSPAPSGILNGGVPVLFPGKYTVLVSYPDGTAVALFRIYSIEELPDGKKYVRADRQVISGNDPESWSEQVEDYIIGQIRRGQDVILVAEDNGEFTITTDTAGKMPDNHTSTGKTMEDDKFYVKANAAVHIDELVSVSAPSHSRTTPDHNGRHGAFASWGWTYRTAFFRDFDGKYYRLQFSLPRKRTGFAKMVRKTAILY